MRGRADITHFAIKLAIGSGVAEGEGVSKVISVKVGDGNGEGVVVIEIGVVEAVAKLFLEVGRSIVEDIGGLQDEITTSMITPAR